MQLKKDNKAQLNKFVNVQICRADILECTYALRTFNMLLI